MEVVSQFELADAAIWIGRIGRIKVDKKQWALHAAHIELGVIVEM